MPGERANENNLIFRLKFLNITFIYLFILCVCGGPRMRSSGDNSKELVIPSHDIGPGIRTQVVGLGVEHFYLLSYLTGPFLFFFFFLMLLQC